MQFIWSSKFRHKTKIIANLHLAPTISYYCIMPQILLSFSAYESEFQNCATSDDLEQKKMTETDHIKYLRIALVVVGLTFFGLWPLGIVWPSGWIWHPGGRSEYLEMIWGIYATLGVFLMLASRDPMAHISLIWFAVWSSIAHSAIMAVQSVVNRQHIGHLWGDVLALIVVAVLLAVLTPRQTSSKK